MSKPNQETRSSANNTVAMDSRKFLSMINSSAESQIKFLSESVQQLGAEQGKTWGLVATNNGRLVIEDSDGTYLVADYAKLKGGQLKINGIRQIDITEGEKSQHFEAACEALIEGIQRADNKVIDNAFNRIAASRFRSTAVPRSGLVKTRDGTVRHISVRTDIMNEEIQDKLVDKIVEELSDRVILTEGEVTGVFSKEKLRLPVSPLMERRVVAYHMREKAKNAYWNPAFQELIGSIAGHICEGAEGIKKVIPAVSQFVQKYQEFNLLNRQQVGELTANALAIKGVFNESLADHTASVLYKTGLKVNRHDIIDAWKKTAKVAEHPALLENVSRLESVGEADFPGLYDQFLNKVFMAEAIGETTRQGLANALNMLKEKINDPEAKGQIDELSTRLQNPSTADDQSVWDAMNLMAKTNGRMETMDQFDAVPGSPDQGVGEVGGAGADELGAGGDMPAASAPSGTPAQTVININTSGGGAPTITGGEPAPAPAPEAAPPSEDLSNALDNLDVPEEEEQTPAPQAAPGGPAAPPSDPNLQLSGLDRVGSPLNEDDQYDLDSTMDQWFSEHVVDANQETGTVAEGLDDEFTLPEGLSTPAINPDYGTKVLREAMVNQRLADIDKLVKEKNLRPEQLQEHLDELAGAALAGDSNLTDPKKMQQAKEELIGAYTTQQAQKNRVSAGATPVVENQHKSPLHQLARRGLKKSAINKLVTENKLTWINRNDKAVLGQYKGITFTIDNEQSPVVLLNHDASVEIPIPENLVPGALYLAEMTNTESTADTFVEWLDQNIEQLRPITLAEEKLVQEAVAKLTVSPDVKIEIGVEGGEMGTEPTPVITEPEPVPSSEVPVEPLVEKPTEPPTEEPSMSPEEPSEPSEESPEESEVEDEIEDEFGDESLEEALKTMFNKPLTEQAPEAPTK